VAEDRVSSTNAGTARLVEAIADGTADLPEPRAALQARREEREQVRADLAEFDAGEVLALHPQTTDVYRLRMKSPALSLAVGG
jgi:hypothetical protein